MGQTDEALLAAHRQGDRTAFTTLVHRHADSLLGYLHRISANRDEAEDLFQETFRRVHERADSFSGRGQFKAWLYTIATNVARDGLRKARRHGVGQSLEAIPDCPAGGCPGPGSPATVSGPAEPQQAVMMQEQKRLLKEALEKLPVRQKSTIILTYYEGLSYSDAARVLNCTIGTVKSQMYRALRTLARYLPDVEGEA